MHHEHWPHLHRTPAPCAEALRRLFDAAPAHHSLAAASAPAHRMLHSGVHHATIEVPATEQLRLAYTQKGQAVCGLRRLPAVPPSPAAGLLQRASRLLLLEEGAMEQDICRWVPGRVQGKGRGS